MLGVERLDGIMEMLKDGQAVSIHTLSKTLYISESTLRRDLAALHMEGLIRRIRGGAILAANNRDVPRLIRENDAPDIKNIIGARAAELVHPGDVILLDPSTTCSYMVPYLPQHTDLLAITSGLKTALALSERHNRTMVTGGAVMDNSYSMVGSHTEPLLPALKEKTMSSTMGRYKKRNTRAVNTRPNTPGRVPRFIASPPVPRLPRSDSSRTCILPR